MGSLVHNYGSDAILNAWNTSRNNKRSRKAANDKAVMSAILGNVSTGDQPNFKPGNRAYEGMSRKFGPDTVKGWAEKGRAAKAQGQLEQAVIRFEGGMKMFNSYIKISKLPGEGASKASKQMLTGAARQFKAVGIDVDINHMQGDKINQQKLMEGLTISANKRIGELSSKSTVEDVAAARMSITMFEKHGTGDNKDLVDSWNTLIDGVEKSVEKNKQREHMLKYQKRQQENKPGARVAAYKNRLRDTWIKHNVGKNEVDFEVWFRQLPYIARVKWLENELGRKMGEEEKRFIGMSDMFGMTAPRPDAPAAQSGKKVVRTGTSNGKKVVEYSDGSIEYAD